MTVGYGMKLTCKCKKKILPFKHLSPYAIIIDRLIMKMRFLNLKKKYQRQEGKERKKEMLIL